MERNYRRRMYSRLFNLVYAVEESKDQGLKIELENTASFIEDYFYGRIKGIKKLVEFKENLEKGRLEGLLTQSHLDSLPEQKIDEFKQRIGNYYILSAFILGQEQRTFQRRQD